MAPDQRKSFDMSYSHQKCFTYTQAACHVYKSCRLCQLASLSSNISPSITPRQTVRTNQPLDLQKHTFECLRHIFVVAGHFSAFPLIKHPNCSRNQSCANDTAELTVVHGAIHLQQTTMFSESKLADWDFGIGPWYFRQPARSV